MAESTKGHRKEILSASESVDAKLHQMHLSRKPGHHAKVDGQQHGRHSKACRRHRQMFPIELLKFIFIHGIRTNAA